MATSLKRWAKKLAAGDPAAAAIAAAGPAIQAIAVAMMRAGMDASVSPDGTPYAPLKKQRPGNRGAGPLIDTGLLRASLSASVTTDQLTLRASRAGAATHQFGSKSVPARPYLGLSPAAVAAIDAVIAREYAKALAETAS